MKFQEKHSVYYQLKGVQFIEADAALLRLLNPEAKSLRRLFEPDKVKLQGEILWDLLDVASAEKIQANRPEPEVEKSKKTRKKKSKEEKVAPSATQEPGSEDLESDPEPEDLPETKAIPEEIPAEGEKKGGQVDEGAGVSVDPMAGSGESGHTEGNDPV